MLDMKEPKRVWDVFAKRFKKSSWQYKDEYLTYVRNGQITVELDIYIKELVNKCQFKLHKDLIYFTILIFILK